jgi:hypothetical protein
MTVKQTAEKAAVAVIGAGEWLSYTLVHGSPNVNRLEGPTGLTMLKTLREDGFAATLYERRGQVGGLWAYSENPTYTTALAGESAPIKQVGAV